MIRRVVSPEILDSLDPSDPRAVRSRQDLRLINGFMRGQEWILQELEALASADLRVIELGAGTGELCARIHERIPAAEVTGIDLIPRPSALAQGIGWHEGDVLGYQNYAGAVVVANLFVHHLSDEQLGQLGQLLQSARAVLLAEPHRTTMAQVMGRVLYPVVNEVTRHDMRVSIEAGFRHGELPQLLGNGMQWEERCGFFGGIRVRGRCL